ncbi:MAG TPA: hypothetical protein VII75_03100, partial [Thermoanaerobaculia bacterium]
VESTPLTHHDVEPLLTPRATVSQSIDVTQSPRVVFGLTGRYQAKSYLDNTNNPDAVAPSFVTVDGNAAYDLTPQVRLSLQINNLTDRRRIFPSGYSYLYFAGNELQAIPYYYPQATRNATVMVDYRR